MDFISKLHNLDQLIAWAGYTGMTIIVFCETGLLTGFFLPGDSLLVTAGFVTSQGKLDFYLLNSLLVCAAIVGDNTGYLIGYVVGPKIFKREDSLFFKKAYLEKTHHFFEKYGAKTIILAHFVPIVRTFAPTTAGVGRMSYRKFLLFDICGSLLWVVSMTSVGRFVGKSIPNVDKHLHILIAAVIVISFMPIFIEWYRHKKAVAKKPQ